MNIQKIITALIVAVVLFIIIGAPSCTQPEASTRLLESNGYTDIVITGYRPWLKGREDFYSTGFEATAPNGNRVTGAVTAGAFKGKTIRFD